MAKKNRRPITRRLSMAGAAAALAAIGALPIQVGAGTLTGNMTASMTVVAACSGFSAGNMSFGSVPQGLAPTATATLTVTCGSGVPFQISWNGGSFFQCVSGNPAPHMGSQSGPSYKVYSDQSLLTPLAIPALAGCAASGDPLAASGTGSAKSVTLYAQTLVNVPVGVYADTAVITLSF